MGVGSIEELCDEVEEAGEEWQLGLAVERKGAFKVDTQLVKEQGFEDLSFAKRDQGFQLKWEA